jgi:two-component system NarL family sensor kinase
MRRLPIESPEPIAWFGALRLCIAVASFAAVLAFDVPDRGELLLLSGAVAIPWAAAILWLARSAPTVPLHPAVAAVDLLILALVEIVVPASYGAVCFLVVFLVAAHAHFQGQQLGLLVAAVAVALFVPIAALGDPPVHGALLAFYEVLFAASVLSAGIFMGRLRSAESTGRLRARELSRRTIEAEAHVRRRVAESIHDGPVQELVGLNMMLDAARRALERDDAARATDLIQQAAALTERNIGALRDEIVSLGPYAFDELTLDAAIEQCAPTWERRFQLEIETSLERLDLSNDACGSLFGIAQEAVANAGRHSGATVVAITVRVVDGHVELSVRDDGEGFEGEQPLGPNEPGHIGLATMRERAELVGGRLDIRSDTRGSTVIARVPLERAMNDGAPGPASASGPGPGSGAG